MTNRNINMMDDMNIPSGNRLFISSEVRFYTVEDLQKMLGWSQSTILKMFNDPKFPAADFGRSKVVEAHALIDYFSRRHDKSKNHYWGGNEGGRARWEAR